MTEENRETVLVNTELLDLNKEDDEKLQSLYKQLGKAYYEGGFEDPLPQLLPIFDEITAIIKKYENKSKICSNCGTELEEDARFCDICGTPVEEEVYVEGSEKENICSNCGNMLRPTAKFCGACGKPVK